MKISSDEDKMALERILIPLDGSVWSFRAAARYAIKIARMAKAAIVCVHAVLNLPYVEYAYTGPLVRRYIEDSKSESQKWYDEVKAMADKAGVAILPSETLVNIPSAGDAIISYAEKNNIDLIIMGTKGRTGLKKFLLGSVASGVISHAKCPVLVVR